MTCLYTWIKFLLKKEDSTMCKIYNKYMLQIICITWAFCSSRQINFYVFLQSRFVNSTPSQKATLNFSIFEKPMKAQWSITTRDPFNIKSHWGGLNTYFFGRYINFLQCGSFYEPFSTAFYGDQWIDSFGGDLFSRLRIFVNNQM